MSRRSYNFLEIARNTMAELERARKERLQRISQEIEKLDAETTRAKEQIDVIFYHSLPLIKEMESMGELETLMTEIKRLKAEHKTQLLQALNFSAPSEPEEIARRSRELAQVTASVAQNFAQAIAPHIERLSEYRQQLSISPKLQSLLSALQAAPEKMTEIDDLDFSYKTISIARSDVETPVKEKAEQIFKEIETLVNSEAIEESDFQTLLAIHTRIYKQAFESNDSFKAAVIEYEAVKPLVNRNIAVFNEAYKDYVAKYLDYLAVINEYEKPSHPLEPPAEKYEIASIEEIYEMISQLERDSAKLQDQIFIREQISAEMGEFGHKLSRNLVFSEKQTNKSYLCESKTGKSAMHVNVFSEGKGLMMETVGLGKGRAAAEGGAAYDTFNDYSALDESQKAFLLKEEAANCEWQSKFIEGLAKRGVIVRGESIEEPDLKHAREVIPATAMPQRTYTPPRPRKKANCKQRMREMKI
jgi:hypothetical protein